MRSLLIFCVLVYSPIFLEAKGSKLTPEQYIEAYSDAAVKEMKRTGVPASITLAQGMLESSYGNSRLARKANNHFGIKCHSDWDGPTIHKDDDAKGECFRKYKSVWESFRDHSNFLKDRKRYAFLFDLRTTDYKGWAKGLKKAGYATNPKYPRLLIELIERYELNRFDDKKYKKRKDKKREEKKRKEEKPIKKKSKKVDTETVEVSSSRVRLSDNYVKYIRVKKGDTFYSLNKYTGISIKRLKKYNERNSDELKLGEPLYLQPKKKGSQIKYHVVKEGETLYSISQEHAVTIKSILKRNRLSGPNDIRVGQKLKLRGRKIKL